MNIKKLLLIAFVFSGMAALIYEVTWIRPLQFLLGSTIYTVSIIFGVFMAGLALGSFLIGKYGDKISNLPLSYALFEIGIGLYGVLLLSIFGILPQLYNWIYGLHTSFYLFEFVQFVLVFVVLLIPTVLMGATFPILVKFYTNDRIGKGVGELYGANNLGAIIGSVLAGFILVPLLGIRYSILLAALINIIIGGLIFYFANKNLFKMLIPFILAAFLVFGIFGDYNIKQMHNGGFYKTDDIVRTMGNVVYYKEGVYATITVRELPYENDKPNAYSLFINGKGQGGSEISDLRVNFLLAYLPLLIKPESKDALVIGLGTGTTSGQLAQFINTTTIEIEPSILGASSYFSVFNMHVLNNSNHTIILADARNYLLKSEEKYNIISQEPSDPWQSFSSTLYSKEFFEIVRDHLSENGVYVHWVPIYTMSVEDFKNFYKTFNEVFPNTVAFANLKNNEKVFSGFTTSEIILVGSKEKIIFDENKTKLSYNSLPIVSKEYLTVLGLNSGEDIVNLKIFNNDEILGYTNNSISVTDNFPILEFSTGINVLDQKPEFIVEDINNYLREVQTNE